MREWAQWKEQACDRLLKEQAAEMGIDLSDMQLAQFEAYAGLLVEWNEKMNLTTITDPVEIVQKHFLDSISGASFLEELRGEPEKGSSDEALSVIDIGTGAGFPGIPLKIVCPWIRLTLLDSLQKRIGFLEEVVKELELKEVACIHGRAEDLAHEEAYREQYDVALSRAVAAMPALLEYCTGYLVAGGLFLAYKGPSLMEEMAQAQGAMKALHMEMVMIHQEISLENEHLLAVFEKTAETSLQYPRKQSKIKNDPL